MNTAEIASEDAFNDDAAQKSREDARAYGRRALFGPLNSAPEKRTDQSLLKLPSRRVPRTGPLSAITHALFLCLFIL